MITNCVVCGNVGPRYKCPTCRALYCSVGCYKKHKTQPCESPISPEKSKEHQSVNERKYDFPTEDTVPVEKLRQLHNSKELKQCLENPHLRDIMKAVVNSSNPTETIASAMREPIFVEMADACLKTVEPPDDVKPC